jgi:hypothetical protein
MENASGRAVWGVDLDRLNSGSRIRIPLRARMFVLGLSMLCCFVQVEALRRADNSSKESYRMAKNWLGNQKRRPWPTQVCTASDNNNDEMANERFIIEQSTVRMFPKCVVCDFTYCTGLEILSNNIYSVEKTHYATYKTVCPVVSYEAITFTAAFRQLP